VFVFLASILYEDKEYIEVTLVCKEAVPYLIRYGDIVLYKKIQSLLHCSYEKLSIQSEINKSREMLELLDDIIEKAQIKYQFVDSTITLLTCYQSEVTICNEVIQLCRAAVFHTAQ